MTNRRLTLRPLRFLRSLRVHALGALLGLGVLAAAAIAAPGGTPGKPAGKGAAGTSLTWFGQSCFLLQTKAGTRVVMDPIPAAIGYTPPTDLKADVVTVSHEHPDHNNVALVGGAGKQAAPKILRGLTEDKKDWVKVKERVKDVQIRSVGVFHDDQQGKQRGLNTVFVFETGGLKIAHLGDLGHLLTDAQLKEIGPVDVVLIPVGGFFTIDAAQATRVLEQLKPRTIVVPMHYKTDVLVIKELAPVDAFLQGKATVRRETGNVLSLAPGKKGKPGEPEIVVLNYK
jgi:L-ascorbate metabolism protein UlaG (beta-lactamase superfamily)